MPLTSGKGLGPYEILAPLGAGGMGEVYRARDTRLERTVAIKVLPSHLSSDPARRQRFEREAKSISGLNHPHICTLHDIGHQDGVDFLVMEYLEGETLTKRLERGPLPLDQLLRYGIEIADALSKAHRQGVIHRDLKPGNIMLTKAGAKLLDFGLAKVGEHLYGAPASSAEREGHKGPPLQDLPTEGKPLTAEGTILGTFQYMAPEHLEGRDADPRTDIFAFGAVLYEMATSRPPFQGKSTASLIAAILTSEPQPITTLQPMTPPALDRAVKRCLAKDPEDRCQSAHDLRDDLKWIAEGDVAPPSRAADAGLKPGATLLQRAAWVLAGLIIGAIIAGVVRWKRKPENTETPRPLTRLTLALPPDTHLALGDQPSVALSPDGARLAYVATRGGSRQIFLRAMDRLEATPIPGTENAGGPFFSPDGQWLGFFAEGKLKKVSLNGGAAFILCDAPTARGGSWGSDDTIFFTPQAYSALWRVSAAGGTPQAVTSLDSKQDESSHRWPEILPDGKTMVLTVNTPRIRSFDDARIVAQSLKTHEQRTLIEGGANAHYSPTGHLVFVRAGALLAVPFDPVRLAVTGSPTTIQEGVMYDPSTGAAQFTFSGAGSLVYVLGGAQKANRTLVWVDRRGIVRPLPPPPRTYMYPRLSPDGQRLGIGIDAAYADVWVYHLGGGTLSRLTFEGNSDWPAWTPDGKRLSYSSSRGGPQNLFWAPADGSGTEERLMTSPHAQYPTSWSPDGHVLAYTEYNPATGWDIGLLAMEGERKPRPFLHTRFNESQARFSPDGRWLAYVSNESGRDEVYVQPFPGPGGKWSISTDGVGEPVWARNGKELFYRNGDKMMVVAVTTSPAFNAARPTLLFEGRYEIGPVPDPAYDVTPDGQRFVMIKGEQEAAPTQLSVVLNWFEELKRRVPTGK